MDRSLLSERPRDMKAALNSTAKPDTTHVRGGIRRYIARACEYGSAKYERANYLRPTDNPAEDFERFRAYLRAAQDHIQAVLDNMETLQAHQPALDNPSELRTAVTSPDSDPASGDVGPSRLPHVAHAAASLQMAIEQAIQAGLLPSDPGRPWEGGEK